MPFLFKLSQRVGRTRSRALFLAVAAAFACEPGDEPTSSPTQPDLAITGTAAPGTVLDLRVSAADDSSITLSFTEVDDGAAQPADYIVRFAAAPLAWGSATDVSRGSCATPVAGGAIGSPKSCTAQGLVPNTKYDLQLVAFRGTLNVDAVFGGLSNVASATTAVPPPVAATILVQEAFEDAAFASRGWYDNAAMATTTAQFVSGSTRALEVRFAAGATTPTWGGAARHLFPESESVYLSYWVKYSDTWVGSGRPYHPHEFMLMTNEEGQWAGLSSTRLTAYVEHSYQNGGIPVLALQDGLNIDQGRIGQDLSSITENRAAAGCNGNTDGHPTGCYLLGGAYTNEKKFTAAQPYFLPSPGPGYKGDWHFVEAYFRLNSIQGGKGVPDGIVRYWLDGRLALEHTDVLLRTGAHPSMKFNQLIIAPYIGDGSPVDQTAWVDNLTLATERPTLTVKAPVASVVVAPSPVSQKVGATQQLTATLKDANGNPLTGRIITWASNNTAVATVNGSGLETGVATGTAGISATSEGISGTAAIKVTAAKPGTVTDLAVTASTASSSTLSFTEVNDGTGQPASYLIRFASGTLSWGSAADVTSGTCATPVAGTAIGVQRTCTVAGLAPSTTYQFQLVAFRGTLNVNAVFGSRSNLASGTTAAGASLPVASVTIAPANVSLAAGGAQQLTATLKDAAGTVLSGRTVTWSSSNAVVAVVTGTGLVTGLLAGSASITATSEGRSGTAVVTVAVTAPPPSGGWANEPAGLSLISEYGFDALTGSGWDIVWNSTTGIVADPTAPLDGGGVLQFAYPQGFTGGSAPGTEWFGHAPAKEVYAGFWWKPSTPWQNHPASNVNKIAFWFTQTGWTNIDIQMYGPGPYVLHVVPEFPSGSIRLAPNVNGTAVTLGVWHRVEWYIKYATTATSGDGIVKWWLDGVLQGSYANLQTPNDAGFTEYKFSPTWGGVGETKTQTDYYWVDHVRLSGR